MAWRRRGPFDKSIREREQEELRLHQVEKVFKQVLKDLDLVHSLESAEQLDENRIQHIENKLISMLHTGYQFNDMQKDQLIGYIEKLIIKYEKELSEEHHILKHMRKLMHHAKKIKVREEAA